MVYNSNVEILSSRKMCSSIFSFFQMQHFKDVELVKVQMEEKASFHKEFDRLKQDLQRTYEMKAKALMDRQKNALDQIQKQQEVQTPIHSTWLHLTKQDTFSISKSVCFFFIFLFKIEENNMYMQRQSLLKEIDRSRERENELKMRMEAFEK